MSDIDRKLKLARRIAADHLRERNPNALMVENIREGKVDGFFGVTIALKTIEECEKRDDRLSFTDRGDLVLHVAWALKPGQPQIIAICTYADLAEKYADSAGRIVPGATGYVEEIVADHAFGRDDIQSLLYKAAMKGLE